jgi:hypothetical protein
MEADWEIEVGGGAPVIEVLWPSFVDLRLHPERAAQFSEAIEFPALAEALVAMNAPGSPVWTSKCDFWSIVDPAALDPDELDAPQARAAFGLACYIDVLQRAGWQWPSPAEAANACQDLINNLRLVPLKCCRVDLVVREVIDASESAAETGKIDLGTTAYLTACGSSRFEAARTLQAALRAVTRVLSAQSTLE